MGIEKGSQKSVETDNEIKVGKDLLCKIEVLPKT